MKTQIGSLHSQMDVNQAKTQINQEKMEGMIEDDQEEKAAIRSGQEMKAVINSIRSELEETIARWKTSWHRSTNGQRTSARNLTRRLTKPRWTYW
jgi:molecular chaperone DnaK (HSP70)